MRFRPLVALGLAALRLVGDGGGRAAELTPAK